MNQCLAIYSDSVDVDVGCRAAAFSALLTDAYSKAAAVDELMSLSEVEHELSIDDTIDEHSHQRERRGIAGGRAKSVHNVECDMRTHALLPSEVLFAVRGLGGSEEPSNKRAHLDAERLAGCSHIIADPEYWVRLIRYVAYGEIQLDRAAVGRADEVILEALIRDVKRLTCTDSQHLVIVRVGKPTIVDKAEAIEDGTGNFSIILCRIQDAGRVGLRIISGLGLRMKSAPAVGVKFSELSTLMVMVGAPSDGVRKSTSSPSDV